MLKHFFIRYYSNLIVSGVQFSIEIYYDRDFDCSSNYRLRCFLDYDIFSNENLKMLIQKATRVKISAKERDDNVEELIVAIKGIPEIDNHYLEKAEKNNNFDKVIRILKICELVPFSSHCNQVQFNELNSTLGKRFSLFNTIPISKEDFETEIRDNEDLQFGYVESYNQNAKYYYLSTTDKKIHLEIYLMTINEQASFYFFKTIAYKQRQVNEES